MADEGREKMVDGRGEEGRGTMDDGRIIEDKKLEKIGSYVVGNVRGWQTRGEGRWMMGDGGWTKDEGRKDD